MRIRYQPWSGVRNGAVGKSTNCNRIRQAACWNSYGWEQFLRNAAEETGDRQVRYSERTEFQVIRAHPNSVRSHGHGQSGTHSMKFTPTRTTMAVLDHSRPERWFAPTNNSTVTRIPSCGSLRCLRSDPSRLRISHVTIQSRRQQTIAAMLWNGRTKGCIGRCKWPVASLRKRGRMACRRRYSRHDKQRAMGAIETAVCKLADGGRAS